MCVVLRVGQDLERRGRALQPRPQRPCICDATTTDSERGVLRRRLVGLTRRIPVHICVAVRRDGGHCVPLDWAPRLPFVEGTTARRYCVSFSECAFAVILSLLFPGLQRVWGIVREKLGSHYDSICGPASASEVAGRLRRRN